MTPIPARYLLRLDDLCPTVKHEPWLRLAALIDELGLRPILAVVPDNRDPDLRVSDPDESFWEQMRAMQGAGAAIALHGYQHWSGSRGRSLVPLHSKSEFTGVSALTQRTWIRAGLNILHRHGLNPTLWAAPRHGFDGNTLAALRAEGITVLSDGFTRRPFLRGGLIWIPQQLWGPLEKRAGLWTICLHVNTATARQLDEFDAFARAHTAQFTSVDEALAKFSPSRLTFPEWLRENAAYARFFGSRIRRGMKRRLLQRRDRKAAHPLR
jgi:predicted deacetylase